VNTDDGNEILIDKDGLYMMSRDLGANSSDPNCRYTVDVKVTPVKSLGKGILIGGTMPRYVRINYCGYIIHLDQHSNVWVGCHKIPINSLPYTSDKSRIGGECSFTIRQEIVTTNGEQSFIVLESQVCDFNVGLQGDGLNSVVVIKRPCGMHYGRMKGLCGDCNGIADDLKECPAGDGSRRDVSAEGDVFERVVESCRTDNSKDAFACMHGEKKDNVACEASPCIDSDHKDETFGLYDD